jgi:hypothetical protein
MHRRASNRFVNLIVRAVVIGGTLVPQNPAMAQQPPNISGGGQMPDRNVQSTPPNSILPFSPAIAPSGQNMGQASKTVLQSKAILMRSGYDVGQLNDRTTARFKAAIFQYQKAHRLPTTGNLDARTVAALQEGGG